VDQQLRGLEFSEAGKEVGQFDSLFPLRPDDDNSNSVVGAEGSVVDVEDPEGVDAAEEPEEARAAKPMRDPGQPTQAERDAHEATHLPFRIWCADCVAGRRDNPADEPAKPEVLMDYCFFR
jgi:hypothetical protein